MPKQEELPDLRVALDSMLTVAEYVAAMEEGARQVAVARRRIERIALERRMWYNGVGSSNCVSPTGETNRRRRRY